MDGSPREWSMMEHTVQHFVKSVTPIRKIGLTFVGSMSLY